MTRYIGYGLLAAGLVVAWFSPDLFGLGPSCRDFIQGGLP